MIDHFAQDLEVGLHHAGVIAFFVLDNVEEPVHFLETLDFHPVFGLDPSEAFLSTNRLVVEDSVPFDGDFEFWDGDIQLVGIEQIAVLLFDGQLGVSLLEQTAQMSFRHGLITGVLTPATTSFPLRLDPFARPWLSHLL